ncbi:MAG: helix-turn-helix transcriptional regulator [Clostridia bacterium]|nr:helix-turn-helix transcriptional regulator [Clostridia bacterium]
MKTTIRPVINLKNTAVIIRNLRREKGLTQNELAKKIGVSRTCVSNWESGARIPDCVAVIKIAAIFQVPVDYVYGMTDHRYNINIPEYFEIDFSKLNPEGMNMLYEYYKYLINNEKYRAN